MKNIYYILLILITLMRPAVTSAQSAMLSGTIFTNNHERDIRRGGETIEILLTDFRFPTQWEEDLGEDDDLTKELIEGFSYNENWDEVIDEIEHTHVKRVNDYLVRITLPAVPDYYLEDKDEKVELKIPSSCIRFYRRSVTASPEIIILHDPASATINDPGLTESSVDGAQLTLTLHNEEFKKSELDAKHFSHNGPDEISIDDVRYVDDKKAIITLGLKGGLSKDVDNFKITVSDKELKGHDDLTTNAISIKNEDIPVITDVTIEEDTYIIGEKVRVFITVKNDQGNTYTYGSGTVAEKSLKNLQRENSVSYTAFFMVNEGDKSYFSSDKIPVKNLQLLNGSIPGNVYSGSINNNTVIDASSPKVNTMHVDNEVYTIGDVIEVNIRADGNDYTAINGTSINGVPLSSSSVKFSHVSGDNYRLSYTVGSNDPEVLPGNLEIIVYLKDAAGNKGGPFSGVDPNSLSIYTTPPTATLSGSQTICEGENAALTINLTGRSPWRIYLSDGNFTTEYNIDDTPYTLNVFPEGNTNYSIESVKDVHGATAAGSGSASITVNEMSSLDFSVDNSCIGNKDTVYFTNTTMDKSLVSNWNWNFDDPESGKNNISNEEAPWHVFTGTGSRDIRLIGENSAGCVDTLVRTIVFEDIPTGSFSLDSDCYEEGRSVLLTSEMESSSSIKNYVWTIIDPRGNEEIISGEATTKYVFDAMDNYRVRLYAETEAGCSGISEQVISMKPTILFDDNMKEYYEDFSSDKSAWSSGKSASSDHLSWDYRMVDFSGLKDNETRAWFTDLPAGPVEELSWVKSPCFNFANMERPMISLDIFRSLSKDDEAVVLQSSTDGGLSWKTVGEMGEGIHWYNSDRIDPVLGDISSGWTGESPFIPDNGWVDARHDLDEIAGQERVQFRIVFSSGHNSMEKNREGFAFDNIRIKERDKKMLLEHFTNTSATDTKEKDSIINDLYLSNFNDVVKLEYHTDFPGADPFYTDNSSANTTRSFYYGISEVPYSLIDGGYASYLRFNYNTKIPEQTDLKPPSLKDGLFKIEINADYENDQVSAEIRVTALRNLEPDERIIHVVVYEKSISGVSTANGVTGFTNVVKEMLPNSAGTAVFDDWVEGQTRTYHFNWDYENVYDPEMIRTAVFIQNDNTREVYQVNTDDSGNLPTAVNQMKPEEDFLSIYPNPAKDYLYIHNQTTDASDFILELFDQTGRCVLINNLYSHENLKRIDISGIDKGAYTIRVRNSDNTLYKVEKILILK